MKLANGLMWIGRALGIIQVLFFAGFIYLAAPSEWWVIIFAVSVLVIVIYSIFLFVSWRRPLLGGILNLVLVAIFVLLVIYIIGPKWFWEYIRLMIPSFAAGVVLLTSRLLKRNFG